MIELFLFDMVGKQKPAVTASPSLLECVKVIHAC